MDKARGVEGSRALAIISTRDHTRLGKRVLGLSGVQIVRLRPFSLGTTGLGKDLRRELEFKGDRENRNEIGGGRRVEEGSGRMPVATPSLRQDQSTPTRGLQLLGSAGEGTNHMSHPLVSPASRMADISGYDVIGPYWVSAQRAEEETLVIIHT
jgi:hypothetical protein